MATIESSLIASEESPTPRYRVGARRFLRRVFRKRSAQIGGVIVLALVLAALLGQWFTPYDPFKIETDIRLQPPSWRHMMGTDEQGRDLLSRIIYGSRYTLMIGVVAVSVAAVPGIFVGLLCAYYGRWVDLLVMRLVDLMLSFPYILLTLAVVAILGPSLTNAMIAVGIAGIPSYARADPWFGFVGEGRGLCYRGAGPGSQQFAHHDAHDIPKHTLADRRIYLAGYANRGTLSSGTKLPGPGSTTAYTRMGCNDGERAHVRCVSAVGRSGTGHVHFCCHSGDEPVGQCVARCDGPPSGVRIGILLKEDFP